MILKILSKQGSGISSPVATYDPIGKYAAGSENMLTFFNAASDDFTLEVGVIQMVQEFRDFLTTV